MEKYCISVDWLQVYCLRNLSNLEGRNDLEACDSLADAKSKYLGLFKLGYSTPLWLDVYSVYYGGVEVATLCTTPRSSALDPRGCTIKLENRILYSMSYVNILMRIIKGLSLEYKGVSRLDICYDCNRLHGSRSVEGFINQYLTATPYTEGHIVRVGSPRFSVYGKRSSSGVNVWQSIRWGSPKSSIGAYCYNKSLELLEVKDKPWIREVWGKAGLISEVDDNTWGKLTDKQKKNAIEDGKSWNYVHNSVWRFEISIKCQGMDILNWSTGELFKVHPSYLTTQRNIEKLFYIYAGKVFHFRKSRGQRTVREYPDMQIFESGVESVNCRPIKINQYADTGRSEKVAYNVLDRLQKTYSNLSDSQLNSIYSAMDFLLAVSGKKASTIRVMRHARYLDSLRASKFIETDDMLYLGALETARLAKKDIDVDFMKSLIDSVRDAQLRDTFEQSNIVDELAYPYGCL